MSFNIENKSRLSQKICKSKQQQQFISIMLITRPFAKLGGIDNSILNHQFKRLSELVKQNSPSADFWLGYFAAYSSPMNQKTHLPFTTNDWTTLSEIMRNVSAVAQDQVIKKQNVIELVVLALHNQIEAAIQKKYSGIDINRIGQRIQQGLTDVALDQDHLKNNFFHHASKQQKKQKYNSYLKQQHFSKKQEQIMQNKNGIKKQSVNLGIECPICLEQVTLDTVCPVSCGHNLHKNCFIEHFKSKVEIKKFPITCPEEGCGAQIIIQDLQQYVPANLLQKYYEFSLHEFVDKNKKNTNWCPTAGCTAVFSHDGQLVEYRCVSCKKNYCLRCKTQSHPEYTCEQNKQIQNIPEEEKQFINFAKGAKMKQCPSCKFWVEKNKGCDHMTCRCKYEFCFRCGAKHGQCNCDQADSYYGDEDEQDEDLQQDQYLSNYQRPPQEYSDEDQQSWEDDRHNVRIDVINRDRGQRPTFPQLSNLMNVRNIFRILGGQSRPQADMKDQNQQQEYNQRSSHNLFNRGRGRH